MQVTALGRLVHVLVDDATRVPAGVIEPHVLHDEDLQRTKSDMLWLTCITLLKGY